TPAIWRSRETWEWVVRHEPRLISNEYLKEHINYIYTTSVEIALAFDAKRRGVRTSAYETYELELRQPKTPIYEKADDQSRIVGHTAATQTHVTGIYAVAGLRDSEYYWKCYSDHGDLENFCAGYVLNSAIRF